MRRDADWIAALQLELAQTGPQGAEAVRYLQSNHIRIGIHAQSAGARWTIDRRIELHPQYAQAADIPRYALSLVIHEVRHLQQGAVTALSVYGELDAWRVQFGFLRELCAEIPGSDAQRASVQALLALPFGWDRKALAAARQLMQVYAGQRYRVDLLPLYPLHRELVHLITRGRAGG